MFRSESEPACPPGGASRCLRHAAVWVIAALLGSAAAATGGRELPAWQQLSFEQRSGPGTVRVQLELTAVGDSRWQLRTRSSAGPNSEDIRSEFVAATGRIVQRSRFSRGRRDRRLKQYAYGDRQLLRQRREPVRGAVGPAADWPVSSRGTIPYPVLPPDAVMVAPYSLLLLAARLLNSDSDRQICFTHTDVNFYRVSLQRLAEDAAPFNTELRLLPQNTLLSGERSVQVIRLLASALPDNPEPDDFSLLGLQGAIHISFDRATGLPLRLQGRAPYLGETELLLQHATMRQP